jgi:prepilin-type N-terminal cleavage/methylation domain-containing protein
MQCRKNNSAFTLVELLAVIAIIGILAGLLTPTVVTAIKQARIRQCQGMLASLKTALEAYRADWGYYPPDSMEPATGPSALPTTPSDPYYYAHPSTPAECLYFYLGSNFTVASENGKINGTGDTLWMALGADPNWPGGSASLNPASPDFYATKTRESYMTFRADMTKKLRTMVNSSGQSVPAPWPSIVDPWGQPLIYIAPGGLYETDTGASNSNVPDTGQPTPPKIPVPAATAAFKRHNNSGPDLYSVGPNGLTDQGTLPIRNLYLPGSGFVGQQSVGLLLGTAPNSISWTDFIRAQTYPGVSDADVTNVYKTTRTSGSGNDVNSADGGTPSWLGGGHPLGSGYKAADSDDIHNW